MPSESSKHPLQRVIELLNRHQVRYLVIGGQAEALMGSPRTTYDIDICYERSPENIDRLAVVLQELEVRLRGASPGLPFRPDAKTLSAGLNFAFESSAGPVDILGYIEPLGGYDQFAERAELYDVQGLRIPTISIEDLIRVKRHIARAKDSESLQQLLSIKEQRERDMDS